MDFDIVVHYFKLLSSFGAENETRTRDPDLGKVVLYQLSYFRISLACFFFSKAGAKVQTFLILTKLFLLFPHNFFNLIQFQQRFYRCKCIYINIQQDTLYLQQRRVLQLYKT